MKRVYFFVGAAVLAAPVVSADALVGYWKMEATNGPVVVDSSRAGSADDEAAWVGSPSYEPGPLGSSVVLDGSQYLRVADSVDVDKAGEDMTVSVWFRIAAWDTPWQSLLAKGEGNRYRLSRRGSSETDLAASVGTGTLFGGSVNDGEWHHVVAVTDHGSETRLYLDGVRVAAGGGAELDDTGADLLIGANPESATLRRWKGGIDDVGLFDEAFGDAEVATLHALATAEEFRYDLGTFNDLRNHYAEGGAGGVHQIGRHGWTYAAADPEDGRGFYAFGEDGSGLAVLESAIHSFIADPAYLSAGESTKLKWETSGLGAMLLRREDGGGPVTLGPGRTGEWMVSPTVTTTYVLRGEGPQGEVEARVVVYVDEQPEITFTAEDINIVSGQKAVLKWTSRGAETLSINRNVGDVLPITGPDGTGSMEVSVAQSSTFFLTATNPLGTVRKPLRINVGELPVIEAFVVNNDDIVPGEAVSFSWRLTGATSATITDVGGISKIGGTREFKPLATATYELTAKNSFGEVKESLTVNVAKLVGVDANGWTVLHRTSQGTIDSLADADALLGGQDVDESAQQENVQVINFGPGEAGEFGSDAAPPLGDAHDDFVVRATGTLVVNFAGEYVFGINNDEGGRLRIAGQDAIMDDALHTPQTSNGSIELDPGTYPIEYVYFDRAEGQAGEVFVVGPNGTNELLSPTEQVTGLVSQDVVINEFMADNTERLDKDGDSSDWIELYNGTGAPLNLKGYYLTDDPAVPNKYALPEMELLDRRYLIVWASGKDTILGGTEIHANFRLNSDGEYLALYKDNGRGGFQVLTEFGPAYPPQRENVSYGYWANWTVRGFMPRPSPRSLNRAGVLGFLGDTRFNIDRGFYEEPFLLEITTDHPAAVIRYSLNGSAPTATKGEIYTGPIEITGTTVVRAAAFLNRFEPTNIDTQTYLFLDDVLTQSPGDALRLGFPGSSVNGQRYQYGMSRAVAPHLVKQALQEIPTVSLVIDQADFSSPSTGIYSNPGSRGRGWERPGSFELLNENGEGLGQVQLNCGIRVRGGFSRSRNNPKHAFRLFFRGEYEGDLEYPIFQEEGANRFEALDLRTSQNYSWAFQNDGRNTFLREIHGRDAQRQMGQPYTRSRYYHLFINSVYWGLYMSQERAENSYGETYLGGDKDFYDVVKSAGNAAGYTTEATDGTMFGAWRDLHQKVRALRQNPNNNAAYFAMQGLAPDGVSPHPDPENNPVLLDVDNLIDYMLAIYYTGNYDAPLSTFLRGASNNWFGMRDQNGTHGFQFFVHDGEHSMGTGSNSNNRVGPWSTGGNYAGQISSLSRSNPQYLHEDLAFNEEYRVRFADRVQKHFFHGGPFTDSAAIDRVTTRSNQIRVAINAELSRWGSGFTYSTWTTARQDIIDFIRAGTDGRTNGEGRASYLLNLLRNYRHSGAKPLFPSVKAPEFNVLGGEVPRGFVMRITDPNFGGRIYYTTDGSDPRLPGGRLSGSAKRALDPFILTESGPVRARVQLGSTWSPLMEADFIVGVGGSAQSLAISELHYNPATTEGDTFEDEDEYEFVELLNVETETTIELAGVVFENGIRFDFSEGSVASLGPGERVLVVRNREAFMERYPDVPVEMIAGEFTGGLDNGGERLVLRAADGEVIKDFRYNDNLPWPTPPDGEGYSLVLNDPTTNPDHGVASNWRSHSRLHGNPGGPDGTNYEQWAVDNSVPGDLTSDSDGDGNSDFFEYVFGSDPQDAADSRAMTMEVRGFRVDGQFGNYLSLTVPLNLAADDVELVPEFSTDLATWTNAAEDFVLEGIEHQGDGSALLRWRTRLPVDASEQKHSFLRLRANQR